MIRLKAKEALDLHKFIWNYELQAILRNPYKPSYQLKPWISKLTGLKLHANCVGCASLPRNKKVDCGNCILDLGECEEFYRLRDHFKFNRVLRLKIESIQEIRDCSLRPGIDPEQTVYLREKGDKKWQ